MADYIISGSAVSTGSFGRGFFDGNVGIGTTNTRGRRLTIEAAADTSNDQLLYLKQTPDDFGWSFNIAGGTTGTLHIKNVASGTESDVLLLKQDGMVGVGGVPTHKLDVSGTGRFTGDLRTDGVLKVGGNNEFVRFGSSTYTTNFGEDDVNTKIIGFGNTTNLYLGEDVITFKGNISGSATSTGSFGHIETSGHIVPTAAESYDLGTAEKPFRDLHVSSGSIKMYAGATEIARIQVSDDDEFEFFSTKGLSAAQKKTFTKAQIRSNATPGKFRGGNIGIATSSTGSFAIVGIGTTSPSVKLDVRSSGAAQVLVGSTDAGSAAIILDGDSNGDGAGGDYSYIQHSTDGVLDIVQDSPSGTNEIRFGTAGTVDKVVIDSSGNVGLGDTSPSEKLDVSGGHINIDTGYAYKIGTNRFLLYNGNTFLGDIDNAGGNVQIREDGATKMTISGGNVGIGMTPTHNFNLRSAGTVEFRIQSTDDDARLQISSDNDEGKDSILEFLSNTSTRGSILYDHNTTAASQKMNFKVGDNAVTAISILGDGKVGIGATSIGYKLDVEEGSGNEIARFQGANSGNIVFRNSTSNEFVMYTGPSDALIFGTGGNNERMRIDASGNVGIGLTSPSAKLHISGGGIITQGSNDTSPVQAILLKTSSASSQGLLGVEGSSAGAFITGTLARATVLASTASGTALQLGAAGSVGLTLLSSGNVGIGETSPSSFVDITFAGDNGLAINSTNSNANLYLQSSGTTKWQFINAPSQHELFISSAAGNAITIQQDGDVGIGTTSPDLKLHVFGGSAGSITSNSNVQLSVENNSHSGIQFLSPNDANNIIYFGDVDDNDVGYINYVHSSNTMNFQTNTAIRMVINGSGNVGIGKTNPSQALDVVGGGSFTTSVFFNGRVRINHDGQVHWGAAYNQGYLSWDTNKTYIGSIGSNALHIQSNATDAIVIDTSQKVGIGTASPGTKLHLYEASAGAEITLERNSTAANIGVINFKNSNGTIIAKMHADSHNATAGRIMIGTSGDYSALKIETDGTVHMPKNLTVGGTLTAQSFVTELTSTTILYDSGSTKFGDDTGDSHEFTGSINVSGSITLNGSAVTSGGGGSSVWSEASSEAYYTGRVGIGTNNPDNTRRLHIHNTDDTRGIYVYNSSATSYAEIHIQANREYRIGTGGASSAAAAQNNFYVYDATAAAHRFTINSSGNVGIGDTSPGSKLVVVGTGDNARFGSTSDGIVLGHGSGFGSIQGTDTEGSAYNALRFRTSGNYAMTIDTSDRVGIGTTSPAVKLDVYGSLNLRSEYNLTWGGTAGANIPLIYGKSGDGGHLAFHSQGTDGESMRIDASGNVGIGESSPDEALHITSAAASATPVILLENSNANNLAPQINLYKNSASPADGDYAGQIDFEGKDSAGNRTEYGRIITEQYRVLSGAEDGIMDLQVAVDGTLTTGVRIRGGTGARVGIGATNPGSSLDVAGEIRGQKFAFNDDTNTHIDTFAADQIGFTLGANNAVRWAYVAGAVTQQFMYGSSASYPSYTFQSDQDTGMFNATSNALGFSTGGSEKMRIDSSGNVGIGATSPTGKLDVRGTVTGSMFHANMSTDAGSPEYSFGGDPDTGMYSAGANVLGFSTGGTVRLNLTNSYLTSQVTGGARLGIGNGSAGAPTFTFNDDPDTGMFRAAANTIAFGVGGSEGARIDSSQRVGLNGITPGNYYANYDDLVIGGNQASGMTIRSSNSTSGVVAFADGTSGQAAYEGEIGYSHNSNFLFLNTAGSYRFTIDADGDVAIGGNFAFSTSHLSTQKYVTVGQEGQYIFANTAATHDIAMSTNIYQDASGNYEYKTTNVGTVYKQRYGQHFFHTFASGTAGNDATPNTALYIGNNGNIGIGTSTAGSKLTILQGVGNGSSYDVIKIDGNTGNYGGMWMTGEWANGVQGRIGFYGTGTAAGTRGVGLIGSSGTTPQLFVANTGFVGIGTTSPDDRLEIYGGDLKITSAEPQITWERTSGAIKSFLTCDVGSFQFSYNSEDGDGYVDINVNGSGASTITHEGNGNLVLGANSHTQLTLNANGTSTFDDDVSITGKLSATSKSFLIDHPTKENKKLQYASLEGPENGVYVRGKIEGNVIDLPDYWVGLVHDDSLSVNLTPIGKFQQLYVEDIKDNQVFIKSADDSEIKCFYTIYGERKDIEKLEVEF